VKQYDRLDDLTDQRDTVLEAIQAMADISITYAYGILDEARRQLDILTSRTKPAQEGEIKTVGQLFTRAYKKWGIYRAKVLKALGVKDPSEIIDFDGAWKKLEAMAEREKFGGQTG
jgi:hypothetical protein